MKKPIENLILLGVSVTLGIVVMEFALRGYDALLTSRFGESNEEAFLHEYDAERGWKNKPNASGFFSSKANGVRVKIDINSKGLRDNEMNYEKPAHTKRILLLDASAIAGFEVNKDQTVDSVLESLLAPEGVTEVINGATRAYGTDQNLLFLRREGYRYEPDVVLYVIHEPDFEDNLVIHKQNRKFGKSYFTLDPATRTLQLQGVPVPENFVPENQTLMSHPLSQSYYHQAEGSSSPSILSRVRSFLYENTFLYRTVSVRLKQSNKVKNALHRWGLTQTAVMEKPRSVIDLEWDLTGRIIAAMKTFTEEIGARFLLFEFSNGKQTLKTPSRLKQLAGGLGIPLIETSQIFSQHSESGENLTFRDGHWNENGHHLAAEIIFEYLNQTR